MITRPASRACRHFLRREPTDAPPIDGAAAQGPVPEHLRPAVERGARLSRRSEAFLWPRARKWAGLRSDGR